MAPFAARLSLYGFCPKIVLLEAPQPQGEWCHVQGKWSIHCTGWRNIRHHYL